MNIPEATSQKMIQNLEFFLAQLRAGDIKDYFLIGYSKTGAYDISGDKALFLSLICNNMELAFECMLEDAEAIKKGLN